MPDDSCAAAAAGIVRAVLGRVDASLWTLRALGAEAHLDELRRSLRDLLAVDEARELDVGRPPWHCPPTFVRGSGFQEPQGGGASDPRTAVLLIKVYSSTASVGLDEATV